MQFLATFTLFFLLFLILSVPTRAHNITSILENHLELSTFNRFLTITKLAAEINRRHNITVCAVDNAAMKKLISKGCFPYTIENVLSLHVLVDYYGDKELHRVANGSAFIPTLFQPSGEASGYVKITDTNEGSVAIGTEENGGKVMAHYVKSIHELPNNISVIQISRILTSFEDEDSPSKLNITSLMSNQGCKAFSDLLIASGTADIFHKSVEVGLTVFCPTGTAVESFMPKYNNLTKSNKASLLLYHGVPLYQSLQMLQSNNTDKLMSTLATNGSERYKVMVENEEEDVWVNTEVVTATVMGTLVDEEPVILYKIDKMLQPIELFKVAGNVKGKEALGQSVQTTYTNGTGRFNFIRGVLAVALGVFFT